MKTEKITLDEINKNIDSHVNEISKEFKQGFEFLKKYPKSVTFFGSARLTPESPHYKDAEKLANDIVTEIGYTVITGGGPGIMEAANLGATEARGESIGLNIKLPNEQHINPHTNESLTFNYFFIRKPMLTFAAETFVFFPGGFGTFDELFGILALIQTKKIPRVPIILFGSDFWRPFRDLIQEQMIHKHRTIDPEDLNLFIITDSTDEAVKIIKEAPVSKWWKIMD